MDESNIRTNYRDDSFLREAFFEFAPCVFPGISFKDWFEMGFWNERYIPYSFLEGSKIVSNVSIFLMDIVLKGEPRKAIQFATVGTLPGHRKAGLSRILMERVIEDYQSQVDFMFLFANDSVLDFYPKFGFKRQGECAFTHRVENIEKKRGARLLDLSNPDDFRILVDLSEQTKPVTERFGSAKNGPIFMWHALYMQSNNLWYIEKEKIVIVCECHDKTLSIFDALSESDFSMKSIIGYLVTEEIENVEVYFTPDKLDLNFESKNGDLDSPLFVRGIDLSGLKFKFPALAQT
ncbi:GNAT family N-acetyltransferase [bacterium]|jgi:hypothetical protein|nr:GNAT family N-acetyltransferase [bacterium]